MTTTPHLIPNHYPDDFCVLTVPLGAVNTSIFKNDREVEMVVDSITILSGARGDGGPVEFRIDNTTGDLVVEHDVLSTASPSSETYNVGRILKAGEELFYVADTGVTNLYVQLRIRSRVA